ncbi:MAG: nuclear transport factor 2 family protein [Phycisphaerae bacterium]|nr:nuclear transport factor 2 family protein [Phycisphaerae bacterium]
MLRNSLALIGVGTLVSVGLLYSEEQIGTQAEEQAIRSVINNEFKALRARDWNPFVAAWAHKPNSAWIGISEDGYVYEHVGWENLEKFYRGLFTVDPQPLSDWEYRNLSISIGGNLAWAAFDKYGSRDPDDKTLTKQSRQFRTLIKEDGHWRILTVIWVRQPKES